MANRKFGRGCKPAYLSATARHPEEVELIKAYRQDCMERGMSVNRSLFELVKSYLSGVAGDDQ